MSAEIIETDNKLEKEAMKVSVVSIIVNIALSLLKLLAGILAKSGAMISDAVHSASDVFSTFVVIIGVKLAGKQPDKEHPYGHERLECVASVILAVVLAGTGIGIGVAEGSSSERVLVSPNQFTRPPRPAAKAVAIVSTIRAATIIIVRDIFFTLKSPFSDAIMR